MIVVELVAAFALGALTGAGELIGRYRDEPTRAVAQAPGLVYLLINGLAAVAALAAIKAFDWRFGLAADASEVAVSTLQVLFAGLAAAALFRTSLFTVRVDERDVGIGPSAVLDVLLKTVDRDVDRRRGIARMAIANELASGLSFERDAPALAAYAVGGLQNLSPAEAVWLGERGKALRERDDVSDDVKIRLFALDLTVLVGEAGLAAAIAQLGAGTAPPVADAPNGGADEPQPVAVSWPTVAAPDPAVVPAVPVLTAQTAVAQPTVPAPPSDGSLDERIARLQRVIELSPELADAHLELGRVLARRALAEEAKPPLARSAAWSVPTLARAEASIEGALRLRPTFVDAHLELGRILTLDEDRHEEAASSLETALRLSDSPEMKAAVCFQLAVLARLRGAPLSECVRWLEDAIATGAAQQRWRLACAALHARLGDLDTGTRRAKQVVEHDPDDLDAWILLGLLRYAADQVALSAEAFARAAELTDPDDAWGAVDQRRIGEALAYHRMGEHERAVDVLAEELVPVLPGTRRTLMFQLLRDEERPWSRVEDITTAVYDEVLVARVGDPVARSRPPDEPPVPLADTAS